GDPRLPRSSAIAIAGGRVAGGVDVREGDRSQVSVERVDLDGRCVVPGFTDAHLHFLEWALALRQLDLSQSLSLGASLDAGRGASGGGSGGLIGHGWRQARWPAGEQPERGALDAACPQRPCALMAHDHHTLWLNSAALAALPAPEGEVVERDAAGELT